MSAKAFLIILLFLGVVLAESRQQLTILHSYPEPDNYNYVELVCVVNDSSQLVNDSSQLAIVSSQLVNDSSQSSSVVSEARFQLNGTDIGEDDEIVENVGDKTIQLLLTQEKEGFFTCSYNESTSSNSIGLAGKIGVALFLGNIPPFTTLFPPQLSQEQSLLWV